ncbi:MAG TPA: oligosaccharide flippase family protein [Cytophagaceae bacterium]|nr:oligosaccharide flippase family protein [Cytophagaceae bacterium]
MSVLKKLLGQTALYGLSSIVGRALNFLLVPFYTAVLLPAEFGAVTELYAYVAFLNILYLYGMETTYFRFATKEGHTEKEVFSNSLSSILLSSILLSAVLILLSHPLASILKYPGKEDYFIWLGLILAVDSLSAIPFARLRLEKKAGQFAFAKIFNISINIGFNLFFLVFCKNVHEASLVPGMKEFVSMIYNPSWDVEYILISNFLASLFTLPILWRSFSGFRISINRAVIKSMLIYSFPLMFMGFAGMIDEMLSRIILKYVLPKGFYPNHTNLEALGVFGACYRLSMFMTLAVQAFRYAADPFFFSQSKDKNAPELFAKVMKWFVISGSFIFLFVSANLSLFQEILRNQVYREGIMVVPVLLMANLFLGIYYNLSIWYKLTDKTHLGLAISLGGAVVTILFNFILIPHFGYMGSAYTTLICYFLMSLASLLWGQKHFPVPYNLLSALGYISLSAALAAFALSYPFGKGNLQAYGFQLMLVIIFIIFVLFNERKYLKMK